MAGDWMKIELELPEKPEVHQIASMLNMQPETVVGYLVKAWAWFDKHTENGHAYGVTVVTVDKVVGHAGFGEAMMFAGWLEQQDKTLIMPKFDRHTSESAKSRALASKRKSRERHDDGVTKARPEKRREEKSIEIAASRRRPKTACPDRFDVNEDMAAWAESKGLPSDRIISETEKFLTHHRSKDSLFKDWTQAWQSWVFKAVEFGKFKPPAAQ